MIVVHKQDGRPGEGGTIVAAQAGYKAKQGESADDLWERALADVFAYWKPVGAVSSHNRIRSRVSSGAKVS